MQSVPQKIISIKIIINSVIVLENNKKSNKNLNPTKKSNEKVLTDNHDAENKDSNERNRKTITEKRKNIENKDTKDLWYSDVFRFA